VREAIAIAGQVIVGRPLSAGDGDSALAASRRRLAASAGGGVLIGALLAALAGVVPHAFTTDPDVIDRANAMWPLFCLLWPFAAVVFALDGILIGAGDARYLAGAMVLAMVVFVPLVLAAGTIAAVWAALNVLMLVRLVTLGARFARGRWALVGATS